MNRDRLLTLAIVGAIALVGVLGWLVGVSPILSQVASADEERANVTSTNDLNAMKLIALKKQFENIGETQTELDKLRGSIPATADMPVFLRTIKEYGDAQGITLKSVEVSGVSAYVAPAAAAPVVTPGAAATTPTPTPTPSTPAAGTTAPVVPAAPSNGLYVVPIKVSVSGTYAQVMAFAGAIQAGPRLFLVTSLALGSVDGVFTGDLGGDVYAMPAPVTAAATAGATATTTP
ncbi:hypothetical protein ACVXZ4_16400 [Lacisediminihabitans sp. FW035]